MAYKFRLLSTYIHWDDPPCRPHFFPYFGGSLPELLWFSGTAGTSLGAVCMRLSKHRAARFLKLKTTGGKTFFRKFIGVTKKKLSIYFWPFIGVVSSFITIVGAHFVGPVLGCVTLQKTNISYLCLDVLLKVSRSMVMGSQWVITYNLLIDDILIWHPLEGAGI